MVTKLQFTYLTVQSPMTSVFEPLNELIARFAQVHQVQPQQLLTYGSDQDVFDEMVHTQELMRIHHYHSIGNNIAIDNAPEWTRRFLLPPFNNKITGRWILLIALDAWDLLNQGIMDSIFGIMLQSPEVYVKAAFVEHEELVLTFCLPFDRLLKPETRFVMQNVIEMHCPDMFDWPEPNEFDLWDASHILEINVPRPQSLTVDLTDIQCSTVFWLQERFNDMSTNWLFNSYTSFDRRRLHYSYELNCLTHHNINLWKQKRVVLADYMAGKDTALLVFLRLCQEQQHQTRSRLITVVVICAHNLSAVQWREKMISENVNGLAFTYDQLLSDIPPSQYLVLDSAHAFSSTILDNIDLMTHKQVIMLMPSAPKLSDVWDLLFYSDNDDLMHVWYRAQQGEYTCEIWNACILTHEENTEQPAWDVRVLPIDQPRLYKQWREENTAYYSQFLQASNPKEAFLHAMCRLQQGFLGFVEAPEIHYELKRTQGLTCSICLEINVILPTETRCRHTFCGSCIRQWLQQSPSCPLCRSEPHPLMSIHTSYEIKVRNRIPFVQKQLAIFNLLCTTQKAIVVSRHIRVLESLARTWSGHPTFFGTNEAFDFCASERGVWCVSPTTLYSNLDLPHTTAVDTVLVLEPYDFDDAMLCGIYRLFTFTNSKPAFVMLRLDSMLDNAVLSPEEAF